MPRCERSVAPNLQLPPTRSLPEACDRVRGVVLLEQFGPLHAAFRDKCCRLARPTLKVFGQGFAWKHSNPTEES
jgi:hypothetical protein